MPVEYKYISADNHLDLLWVPKNAWQDRVAARFKDAAPKVVETENGTFWEWEGKLRGPSADGRDNAKHRQHFANMGVQTPEGSLPPSDPKVFLEHMDMAGIYSAVIYGFTRKPNFADPELWRECYRAYNDFLLDFDSYAPERILAPPQIPVKFPEDAGAEFERVVQRGAKAVEFVVFDAAKPIIDPVWEPLWAAAEEADVPICCHIGDGAGVPYPINERGALFAHFSVSPFAVAKAIPEFIFGGVLERHPKLRLSFVECRIGWLPFLIYWMDRQVDPRAHREPDPYVKLSLIPSEYVKRQMTFTFEDDMIGARLLDQDWAYIGDSAIWGADYPHGQGVWPNPEPTMAELFAGKDPALQREITFDRAARFFNIRIPSPAAAGEG
ncbi:MAG TPA: amidohydrolase family protein [Chloroflexota bacterium]|nr:amidohydrolase family protein [Chloroflexota bacterium]